MVHNENAPYSHGTAKGALNRTVRGKSENFRSQASLVSDIASRGTLSSIVKT